MGKIGLAQNAISKIAFSNLNIFDLLKVHVEEAGMTAYLFHYLKDYIL